MQALKSELLSLLDKNDLLRSTLFLGRVQDTSFRQEFYVERVMEVAAKVWHRTMRAKYDPILKAQAIREVMFSDLELKGKHERYKQVIDDPSRFYLHSLLDKRAGSPLVLTVLFQILADQVGLNCEVYALPSSYVIKVNDPVTEFYVDVFDRGNFLSGDDFQKKVRSAMKKSRMISTSLFERVDRRQLVIKLLQQLKHSYILKGRALEALRAVELLTAIYPESPELTRDRGILYCEMEYFSKAMEDLKYYLRQCPNADDVREIKKLTSMLQGYQEIIN